MPLYSSQMQKSIQDKAKQYLPEWMVGMTDFDPAMLMNPMVGMAGKLLPFKPSQSKILETARKNFLKSDYDLDQAYRSKNWPLMEKVQGLRDSAAAELHNLDPDFFLNYLGPNSIWQEPIKKTKGAMGKVLPFRKGLIGE